MFWSASHLLSLTMELKIGLRFFLLDTALALAKSVLNQSYNRGSHPGITERWALEGRGIKNHPCLPKYTHVQGGFPCPQGPSCFAKQEVSLHITLGQLMGLEVALQCDHDFCVPKQFHQHRTHSSPRGSLTCISNAFPKHCSPQVGDCADLRAMGQHIQCCNTAWKTRNSRVSEEALNPSKCGDGRKYIFPSVSYIYSVSLHSVAPFSS